MHATTASEFRGSMSPRVSPLPIVSEERVFHPKSILETSPVSTILPFPKVHQRRALRDSEEVVTSVPVVGTSSFDAQWVPISTFTNVSFTD